MGDLNRTVTLEVRGHLARRRLKRNDVANVLDVSLRTVSDLLGERRPWRVDEIETIAAWLDISVSELLFPKHASYNSRRPPAPRRNHADEASFDFEASALKFEPRQERGSQENP
ncbi:MAG: helix-turn-helix domain-containing protein [Segniliparus sp.]|uniref:helix-turn-helix domain-containing protein n=1 Tax=Segniliparus sp. TaxID=2804064 RepID=UPI003F2D854A